MVTEQVKRISAALRAVGFKRNEFTCRSERYVRRPKGERPFTEFGPALATFKHSAGRTLQHKAEALAERIVEQGEFVVEVFYKDDALFFVTVRETKWQEQARVLKRDLDAEHAEAARILASV
jgi:hypothetical protein